MQTLLYVLIFALGLSLGVLIKVRYIIKFKKYSGTIYVNKDKVSEKIVYTLELDDYPETLQFKKMIVFKVDNTDI